MGLTLKGINLGGFAGYELVDQLQYNLKFILDWGLLHHGGYNLYLYDQDSYFAENESKLHSVIDERYPVNCVWNGVGREWVWESGVTPMSGGTVPFRVSGVYINGTFIPSSDTGPYRHHIDYRHGRIIFDESQNPNDDIRAEYCSRSVYVGFADSEEFQTLMLNSVEEFLTNTVPSGTPSREHEIWLPSIFIDVDSGEGRGLQLGGGQIKTRTISLHIFADNPNDRNLLMDWLDYNNRSAFVMADLNSIQFPFDQYGDIVSGATNWIDLMNNYPWKKMRILEGTCKKLNSLNTKLFRAIVKYKVEIDFGGI
jgi:hypothetical protein